MYIRPTKDKLLDDLLPVFQGLLPVFQGSNPFPYPTLPHQNLFLKINDLIDEIAAGNPKR